MVSFQTPNIPPNHQRKRTLDIENLVSSKKRRLEERGDDKDQNLDKGSKTAMVEKKNLLPDIDFELETPLPSEWQRCLNIQSGEIHYYNTRTHKRTSKDPRQLSPNDHKGLSHDPDHISLDLELNLGYESSIETHVDENPTNNLNSPCENYDGKMKNSSENLDCKAKNCDGLTTGHSPWVSFEVDQREMVAAVCMQCHMLVMLCKSSPSCPNCRFMHALDQQIFPPSPSLSKSRFRLLYCKDELIN